MTTYRVCALHSEEYHTDRGCPECKDSASKNCVYHSVSEPCGACYDTPSMLWPHTNSEQPTKIEGKKNDAGKSDISLIPLIAQEEEAKAFMVGEVKYGRYNYCEGIKASRQMGALLRHALAWFNGEERDPIDGQHHLGSVRACAAMILREMELGTLIDDRYTKGDKNGTSK